MLFVTDRFPYPTVNHAGGFVLFELIKALREKGIVIDLLSFINSNENQFVSQMQIYCEIIETIPSKKKFIECILDFPKLLFKPRFFVDAFQRRLVKKLIKLQKMNTYDIIQFEWTQMCQYEKYVKENTPKILSELDVSIIPVEREYLKQTNFIKKLIKWWTYILLKKCEPKYCEKFDLVLTVSNKDSEYLKRINPKIKTFKYPLLVKKTNRVLEPPPNKEILFLGHLGRPPNIEAVEWFYKNVFVDIIKKYPDAIFVIVGAEPHNRIFQIAKYKNVKLFENVENPEDYYIVSRVFVSPLKIGGGIIMKNLDAMGLGCPLITTSIGNEGINGIDGRDVLIANTREEYIKKLEVILNDNNYWKMISTNAKMFIDTYYDFNTSIDKLIEQYNLLIRRRYKVA